MVIDMRKRQFHFKLILLLGCTWILLGQAFEPTNAEVLQCHGPDGVLKTGIKNCFKCVASNETIFSKNVCDGRIQCNDFSDECLCSRHSVPIEICNILYDLNTVSLRNCGINGDFTECKAAICRNKTNICGGNKKCLEYIKIEFSCKEDSSERENLLRMACVKTHKDGRKDSIIATTCDGIIECDGREDECNSNCFKQSKYSAPVYCRKDFSCLPGSWICDGEWDSPKLSSCTNIRIDEEELGCKRRFYCQNKLKISIDESKLCNFHMDCDDGSDESLDRNCTDSRYYCHDVEYLSTHSMNEIETAFIKRSLLFDGTKDCSNGRDECNIGPLSFHSESEMISSTGLRIMVWIFGIVALLGNLSVIYFTLYTVRKKRKSLNPISCGHHTLLLNLSLADLLMSIYLLAIGVKSILISGDYCEEDLQWRSSATCTALGVISMVSSEMSVMVMLSMSVFRFVTIYKPLLAFRSKQTDYAVKIVVVMAWAMAITISMLPIIGELDLNFAHEVALHCHVFDSYVVGIAFAKGTASRYVALMHKINSTSPAPIIPTTIQQMNSILGRICPYEIPPQWFGFYGQNSVCMPRIFAEPSDPMWEISIAMITYNIVAFFVLIVLYGLIIKVSTKNSKHLGPESAIPKCKLQARVTRLLISDFACWVPVCIIGFLYASGRPVSPTLYATCGIVLLPINSALNPFLYSSYCDKLIGAALGLCGKKTNVTRNACTMLTKNSNDSQEKGMKKVSTEITDFIGRSSPIVSKSKRNDDSII